MNQKHTLSSLTLFLLSFFTQGVLSGSSGCVGTEITPEFTQTISSWTFTWFIDCSTMTLNFSVSAPTNGWVGIGFGESQKMFPSDIIMAWVDDNTGQAFALDKWATKHAPPQDDTLQGGQSNILTVSGTQANGVTKINITRLLDTGDSKDLAITSEDMNVLYAFNANTDEVTSRHTTNGATVLQMFSGASKGSKANLKLFHGITMLLSWGFLVVQGTFIARFLKGIGDLWVRLHITFQGLTLLGSLMAFIVIEKYLGSGPGSHFNGLHGGLHQIFGLIIVIFVIIQSGAGWLALVMYDPNRTKTPVFPDKIHIWLGRFIILLGFVTIFLGFEQIGAGSTALYVIFAVWVASTYILSFIVDFWNKTNSGEIKIPVLVLVVQILLGIALVGACIGLIVNKVK
eukprot:TRINITY_DN3329_c0_g1_i1.p1 TRINITY_DN3329_c0_g1~~TRINITY_DN3329_c0_g1_i1.p1  ORF type:complete len:400 (+),score=44.87 TRINITY_DN3329_c0_g1_i1:262-1461(+)